MNVRQLIAALSQFDPESDVVYAGFIADRYEPIVVYQDTITGEVMISNEDHTR